MCLTAICCDVRFIPSVFAQGASGHLVPRFRSPSEVTAVVLVEPAAAVDTDEHGEGLGACSSTGRVSPASIVTPRSARCKSTRTSFASMPHREQDLDVVLIGSLGLTSRHRAVSL